MSNCGQTATANASVLELREWKSLPIRSGGSFIGVEVAGEQALVWYADGYLTIESFDSSQATAVPEVGDSIIGAAFVNGNVAAVTRSAVVQLVGSTWNKLATLPTNIDPWNAAYVAAEQSWFVGGVDSAGNYLLLKWEPREWVEKFRVDRTEHNYGYKKSVRLNASTDALIVSLMTPPYRAHVVIRDSSLSFAPPDAFIDLENSEELWVLMSTIPVACGYLQTYAELRSDQRKLVLYDELGKLTRVKSLSAAFGLVSSGNKGRIAIGVRFLDARELVMYTVECSKQGLQGA